LHERGVLHRSRAKMLSGRSSLSTTALRKRKPVGEQTFRLSPESNFAAIQIHLGINPAHAERFFEIARRHQTAALEWRAARPPRNANGTAGLSVIVANEGVKLVVFPSLISFLLRAQIASRIEALGVQLDRKGDETGIALDDMFDGAFLSRKSLASSFNSKSDLGAARQIGGGRDS